MFWSQSSVSSSHLETLLNKDDVTLQELMDEDEVLQECKSQNKRLIEYLIRADVLEELVTLTTVEPSQDCDDNVRYKYPNIACELLTCEVPQLSHRLANDEVLLSKLYSFLETDPPLNPLLASFFSKTFSALIARTSEQVLEFLKSKENSVGLLLKHLGTSAIMDLLFKLITKVEGNEMKQNILNWLDEQQLVEKIVGLLDASVDSDIHYNAAELLCNVIRTGRESAKQATGKPEEDLILAKIESPEVASQMLDLMLKEPRSETSIVGGISVLLTLMESDRGVRRTNYESVEDVSEQLETSSVALSTIQCILPRLQHFHQVLLEPPSKPVMRTTTCVLDPPLGQTRVEVTKLMSHLVSCRSPEILAELARLDTITVMLDLFLRYTWNNFLHTEVFHCLAHAVMALNITEPVADCFPVHILVKCRLLERILDAWDENETLQKIENKPRRGYMGHLIKISNLILEEASKSEFRALMEEYVEKKTLDRWEEFVSDILDSINTKHSGCLGGGIITSAEENAYINKGVTFPDNNSMQEEYYTNYHQLQTLAPAFTEQFGSFHEEQFNENDDVLNGSSMEPRLEKLLFNVDNEDLDREVGMFKQVCTQKLQTLDCDDSDLWNSHGQAENNASNDWQDTGNNSSSDEDNEGEEAEEVERSGPEGSEAMQLGLALEQLSVADKRHTGETVEQAAPVVDSNPWGEPPSEEGAATNLDWAVFDNPDLNSVIASFVAGMGNDVETCSGLDLTPSDGTVSVTDMFEERPVSVEQASVCQVLEANETVIRAERLMDSVEPLEPLEPPSADPDELVDNYRFLSTQGLITNSQPETNSETEQRVHAEEVPPEVTPPPPPPLEAPPSGDTLESGEMGDVCLIPKENVQLVPNETTQTSNVNSEGATTSPVSSNGPV